ncbi:MAG: PEP-CTERM sorting domain-containing protein [Aquabacterium sp.]|uniref:PEP-CTERM sorting domain-containing protein n=1 Tax=Aquabacterium sp. TaxID=1872578 RepID=UPI001D467F89|nr:PEP-CTERM sorting domain-containing protein [Aquabacterium sp.]MBT9609311.1 PEP-CTERM sorting domain-containing protein [Aquabacterium sp.]
MKLQHIAAAVALAVTGTANAAIQDFTNGNGSLFLVAYDNANGSFTQTASLFDLGFNLNDIAGVAGNGTTGAQGGLVDVAAGPKTVVWNFNSNTVTVNGTVQSIGTNAWSANFAKLVANSDAGQIKWTVGAGDSSGFGDGNRYLITGQPTAAQLTSQNASNTNGLSVTNSLFGATVVNKGTLSTADNGAWTFAAAVDGAATATNGYVIDSAIFGTNWRTRNLLGNAIVLDGASQNLWLADASGAEKRVGQLPVGQTAAGFLNNSTTLVFNSAAGTLTMSTAAAIPEPSTYAMALVGLALAGVVARRRRA